MIVIILLLIGTIVFLAYIINQDRIEINNLKNNAEIYEKEKNEYKNTINNLETKIIELNKLANNNKNIKYEIVKELPKEIKFDKETKGTEIVEFENNYYVFIKMGAKGSSGFGLEIENVIVNGIDVDVYIKEIKPEEGLNYLTVITYPYAVVKFDFKPNVNVIYN